MQGIKSEEEDERLGNNKIKTIEFKIPFLLPSQEYVA